MRQVNRDEIISNMRTALRKFSAALWRDLASRETERRHAAHGIAAGMLADALGRYEVLSNAPLDHPFGDALFETAEQRRQRGVKRLGETQTADDDQPLGGPR